MPVRIANIELWSSRPIGGCWRDGLNKWLAGSVALPRTSSSAARSFPRTFHQAALWGTLQSAPTHNISNKKPTLRRQANQAVPPHGPIAGCRPLTPKAEHSAIMAEVASPRCHSRATHPRFAKKPPPRFDHGDACGESYHRAAGPQRFAGIAKLRTTSFVEN